MSRYLDPKSDIVFKKVFGAQPHLLKSFLNALLPLPEDRLIEELVYLPPEQVPLLPALKYSIVDVKCVDKRGRTFIVEMQIQWTVAFMQRILFNTSAAYVHQLNKGEAYASLSPVYGLALLAHHFQTESAEWFHHYKMSNVKDQTKTLDDIQIILVELPKFKPATIEEKKLTVLWLRFLSEIDEKTRVVSPELLAVPEIMEAVALSEESAYTPAELATYWTYWDAVRSEKTLLEGRYLEGKAAGIEEGKAVGIAEGKAAGSKAATLEIAKKMLARGTALEIVLADTGLTREELEK